VNRATAGPAASGGRRWIGRFRSAARIGEGAVVVLSLAVIAGSAWILGVLAFDPERGETWTSGLRPPQFFQELDTDLLDDYAGVVGIAHNSGDRVEATLEAVIYDADVIEVDVVSFDGQLYASHGLPIPLIGGSLFRGPPLAKIWAASAGAGAIKLDLKESSPEFQELLFTFLANRRGQRRVLVVSDDPALLRRLAEREPAVFRIYSVGSANRLRLLDDDPAFTAVIDGVSIRHGLVDEERAARLKARGLLILAWTVNDLERVNELVRLGVDGITTDNLAILRLLGSQHRGEHPLDRLGRSRSASPPGSVPDAATPVALTAADATRLHRGRRRRRGSPAAPTRGEPRPPTRSAATRRGRSWRRRRR
jgi:hypothetical protein